MSDPGFDDGGDDAGDQAGTPPGPQWGIFDQGLKPVIVGDSCVLVDFRKQLRISDYPVEQGGFASYNKVATPYDFKMTFTKGGASSDRQDFLASVDALVNSLSLYNAVTPDVTYPNANAVSYGYTRTAVKGMTLLTVDIYLEEVRQTAKATFSSTGVAPVKDAKDPNAVSQVNDGPVQAYPPTDSQKAIVLPLSSTTQLFQ